MPREALAQPRERDKAVKILARTLFRQLKTDGYDARQIITLSSELIGLVTTEFRSDAEAAPDADTDLSAPAGSDR
jgi:hypothetical protein